MIGDIKACEHCATEFVIEVQPRGRERRFCSTYCRGRAYYEANREASIARSREYRERQGDRRRQRERARHLRATYNMSVEDYDRLLEQQGGVCAICQSSDSGNRPWQVDHDHRCCPGRGSCGSCIRGLLCASCNRGIGWLRDDPKVIKSAADYVERMSMVRGV